MSLTADPSLYTALKLPPVFPGNSVSYRSDSVHSFNFSSNSVSRAASSARYQLSYGTKMESLAGEPSRTEPQIRMSGIKYLRNLPTVFVRTKDSFQQDEDVSKRSAFPETASVSLPTSTTTLEYLLHKRSSRSDTAENSSSVGDAEGTQKPLNNRSGSKGRSTSYTSYTSFESSVDEAVRKLFHLEPCLYTHQMFLRAARIIDYVQNEDPNIGDAQNTRENISVMDVENTQEEIMTLELAFETLKFHKLFQEMLDKTEFFPDFPHLANHSSLVHVILYDVQSRKFQKRTPLFGELLQQLCSEIEAALLTRRTRMQAFIAKIRIKHNAASLEDVLPGAVRNLNRAQSQIPVYMWVNQLRTTMEYVLEELEADGFTKLAVGEDVSGQTGKVFMTDSHCSDLLAFPPNLATFLKDTRWVQLGQLVEQDKSSCMAAQSVQYLLGTDKDVIHVNVGSGLTTAHLVSLLCKKSPQSRVWGFGIDSPSKGRKTMKNIDFLGATKNTKFLLDDFLSLEPEEPKLRYVKVILITANCSKSAITNPVQFLISEGEDIRILGDLAKGTSSVENMDSQVWRHEQCLRHALSFSRVQAVVYATRSCHPEENESLVTRAVEFAHMTRATKGIPFRVTPPVLPFTFEEIDSGRNGIDDRYIRFHPSDKSNGCFIAVISREPEDHKDGFRSMFSFASSRRHLTKTKSTPLTSEEQDTKGADSAGKLQKLGKGGNRRLKAAMSTPEVKAGISSTLAGHRSPVALGARLYQAGLVHKMEQRAKQKSSKLEQFATLKHPPPFSPVSGNEAASQPGRIPSGTG